MGRSAYGRHTNTAKCTAHGTVSARRNVARFALALSSELPSSLDASSLSSSDPEFGSEPSVLEEAIEAPDSREALRVSSASESLLWLELTEEVVEVVRRLAAAFGPM